MSSELVDFLRSSKPTYDLEDVDARIEDARYEHDTMPVVRFALDAWKHADPVDAAGEIQAIMECDEAGPEELHRLGTEPIAPDRVKVIVEFLKNMDRPERTAAISILHELMIERCEAVTARAAGMSADVAKRFFDRVIVGFDASDRGACGWREGRVHDRRHMIHVPSLGVVHAVAEAP